MDVMGLDMVVPARSLNEERWSDLVDYLWSEQEVQAVIMGTPYCQWAMWGFI